jgi:predicted transcriptional regulator
MNSTTQIIKVIEEYIHRRADRDVMRIYLTDHPGSLEKIAEETELSVSTVKRIISRNSFIYKYFPDKETEMN